MGVTNKPAKQYKYIKKTGRPTKYNPAIMVPQIEEYLASCGRENTELPTIEGLADALNINTDTLYEWTDRYPEFSDAIKKILSKQKNQLMNDGMYGGKEVNAAMAIFLLKANHGLKDGTGQTNVQVNNFVPILGKEDKAE